jgi:hypothetical protein
VQYSIISNNLINIISKDKYQVNIRDIVRINTRKAQRKRVIEDSPFSFNNVTGNDSKPNFVAILRENSITKVIPKNLLVD